MIEKIEPNKYKIIFIIFLIAGILSVIIYNMVKTDGIYFTALGDELCKGITPFETYNKSYNDYVAQYLKNKGKIKYYNPYYCEENKKIENLIDDIKNDKEIKLKKKVLNAASSISKADIITISFNNKEIYLKSDTKKVYTTIDNHFNKMLELISLIEKLSNADIYIVSYYTPLNEEKLRNYIYDKFIELEDYKNVHYIDINKKMMEKAWYIPDREKPYPSLEGYNYISSQIIRKINEKT